MSIDMEVDGDLEAFSKGQMVAAGAEVEGSAGKHSYTFDYTLSAAPPAH